MAFLAVVFALGAMQLIGPRTFWQPLLALGGRVCRSPIGTALFILLPTCAVAALYLWLSMHMWLLALPFAAVVLWLSIVTAEHKRALEQFINAGRGNHWQAAVEAYQQMGGAIPTASGPDEVEADWPALNKAALERAAYLGFAQIFAPVLWFCLLGPAGALGYRLILMAQQSLLEAQPAHAGAGLAKLIWLLEWPGVRLLGLTFAFTGNFLSCMERWFGCLLCTQRSSADIITHYVMGALGVAEGNVHTPAVTRRELLAMARLLRRSLWFWVGALALLALLGW